MQRERGFPGGFEAVNFCDSSLRHRHNDAARKEYETNGGRTKKKRRENEKMRRREKELPLALGVTQREGDNHSPECTESHPSVKEHLSKTQRTCRLKSMRWRLCQCGATSSNPTIHSSPAPSPQPPASLWGTLPLPARDPALGIPKK